MPAKRFAKIFGRYFLSAYLVGSLLVIGMLGTTSSYTQKIPPFSFLRTLKKTVFPPISVPDQIVPTQKILAHNRRVSLFRVLKSKPQIVLLGDSLTHGGEWQELLPDVAIVNRGISGDTTAGILGRLDEIITRQPRKVFLMIGINDLAEGLSPEQTVSGIQEICRRLRDNGIEPVLQSTLYTGKEYQKSNPRRSHANVWTINQAIRKWGEQEGISFVNLNEILAPGGFLEDKYSNDGVHLNGAGYLEWAQALHPYLD